jgi:hypothetical protein
MSDSDKRITPEAVIGGLSGRPREGIRPERMRVRLPGLPQEVTSRFSLMRAAYWLDRSVTDMDLAAATYGKDYVAGFGDGWESQTAQPNRPRSPRYEQGVADGRQSISAWRAYVANPQAGKSTESRV